MPFLNLDLDYFDHPKIKRLVGLLGRGAAELPIRIWCYCGKYHAESGSLASYSGPEIESLAAWWGQSGDMMSAMERVDLLIKDKNGWRVKDWSEINGHLAAFKNRARKAAQKRWRKISMLKHAPSIAQASPKQCPNLPTIPTIPTNLPTIKKRFAPPAPEEVTAYAKSLNFLLDGKHFCDYYEARGWMLGRSAMKSWQAAVSTWKKRGGFNGSGSTPKVGSTGGFVSTKQPLIS